MIRQTISAIGILLGVLLFSQSPGIAQDNVVTFAGLRNMMTAAEDLSDRYRPGVTDTIFSPVTYNAGPGLDEPYGPFRHEDYVDIWKARSAGDSWAAQSEEFFTQVGFETFGLNAAGDVGLAFTDENGQLATDRGMERVNDAGWALLGAGAKRVGGRLGEQVVETASELQDFVVGDDGEDSGNTQDFASLSEEWRDAARSNTMSKGMAHLLEYYGDIAVLYSALRNTIQSIGNDPDLYMAFIQGGGLDLIKRFQALAADARENIHWEANNQYEYMELQIGRELTEVSRAVGEEIARRARRRNGEPTPPPPQPEPPRPQPQPQPEPESAGDDEEPGDNGNGGGNGGGGIPNPLAGLVGEGTGWEEYKPNQWTDWRTLNDPSAEDGEEIWGNDDFWNPWASTTPNEMTSSYFPGFNPDLSPNSSGAGGNCTRVCATFIGGVCTATVLSCN